MDEIDKCNQTEDEAGYQHKKSATGRCHTSERSTIDWKGWIDKHIATEILRLI